MIIHTYLGIKDSIPMDVIIFMSVYLSLYEKNHYNLKLIPNFGSISVMVLFSFSSVKLILSVKHH